MMAARNSRGTAGRTPKSIPRSFFLVTPNWRFRTTAGFAFENESALLLKGQITLRPEPGRRGFPDYPEPPRIVIDPKLGRHPSDFEEYSGYWLISDRLKEVLEAVDSEGCAFVKCDVRHSRGQPEQGYWLFDVLRMLDAVDESASRIIIVEAHGRERRHYRLAGRAQITFRLDVVDRAHIFRLAFGPGHVFCDEQLKQACKQSGIKGISFKDAANL
jgi:Protein of unknown function (DUF1629)